MPRARLWRRTPEQCTAIHNVGPSTVALYTEVCRPIPTCAIVCRATPQWETKATVHAEIWHHSFACTPAAHPSQQRANRHTKYDAGGAGTVSLENTRWGHPQQSTWSATHIIRSFSRTEQHRVVRGARSRWL